MAITWTWCKVENYEKKICISQKKNSFLQDATQLNCFFAFYIQPEISPHHRAKRLPLFYKISETPYLIDETRNLLYVHTYLRHGVWDACSPMNLATSTSSRQLEWPTLEARLCRQWSLLIWETPWADRISILPLLAWSRFITMSWRPKARTKCKLVIVTWM